jgi:hypothetical protein
MAEPQVLATMRDSLGETELLQRASFAAGGAVM